MPRKKQYDTDVVTHRAMKLFWERGFKATSLRDLEKAMAINQFSIYATFKNKEGLFIEALRKFKEYNRNGPFRPIIESAGQPEDLRKFLEGFVSSVKEGQSQNGCLFANTLAELGTTEGPIKEELQDYLLFLETIFLEYAQKAQEQGVLRMNQEPEKTAAFLVNSLMGLALTSKVHSSERLQQVVDNTYEAVFL